MYLLKQVTQKSFIFSKIVIIKKLIQPIKNLSLSESYVYELYLYNEQKTNIQKHSYASIPDIQTSKWVKELTDNNLDAIVQCKYNPLFKKWTPIKEGHSTDTLLDVKE